jgi:ABC-type bacteriocin/lantibiotic exporter with double-glycine peptidase domain
MMKGRHWTKRLLLAGGLALVLLWTNVALATVLNVPQRYQEQTQWCWAGCSQAILEYYGTIRTQTEIAQYGTDGANIWNWLYGSSTDPTRNGIDLILLHFAGLSTTPHATISEPQVQTEITARRPFVIRWGWDSGGGHFVVGKGIEGDYVYLMDPWYGPTINTYSWVVRGSSHTWTDTLTLNTAPAINPVITGIIELLLAD